ncbi:ABC-ATPase domain-containing protein [Alkalicoccus chagannorensis]|uniref:ABC-ATPase domain-containing protein n=1 Tax=Alkalicoccus chagannorensis TaxID=427072 RepID=UPI0003FB2B6B|nr:ABC-ATPase domain-containing protein [Alkalicoccus chagannorensis]
MTSNVKQLNSQLRSMDNKSYRALKSIQGTYEEASGRKLHIDYVQGDPFAAPSRIRVSFPLSSTPVESNHFDTTARRTAVKHYLTSSFEKTRRKQQTSVGGTGKSGMVMIDTPGPEMLDRSSVYIDQDRVEFRISCGIPAKGRKILGKQAAQLLTELIPETAEQTLRELDMHGLQRIIKLADDQVLLRQKMKENNLVAFAADGALLPRESGASSKPMKGSVIPFQSPEAFRFTFSLSDGSSISGMGIEKGVTLIVGGGYHGKSTLLQAFEHGVYNHEPGDGREYVLADASAVKIRAEDGRSIRNVNISPFINELPMGKKTETFTSADASGSTSQAANIVEAMEAGASTLFIDEDTSATNFMIRDARMQKLVSRDKEPITPFIDRVRQLFDEKGISTILVLGGSGDYFDVADRVIMMDEYIPYDVTERAAQLTDEFRTIRSMEGEAAFPGSLERPFHADVINKKLDQKGKIQARGLHQISIGKTPLPLHDVEQLVSSSQTETIAAVLKWAGKQSPRPLTQLLDDCMNLIEKDGIDAVSPFQGHPGSLAMPRRYEIAAALNRIRS